MHPTTELRRFLTSTGLFLGFWLVLFLAFAAQLVFTASFTWEQALRASLHDWMPWVVLSPGVIWLARRFPLEVGRLRWSVPAHLAGCILALLAGGWISGQLLPRPFPPGMGPRAEMMRRIERDSPPGMPPPRAARPPPPGTSPVGPPHDFRLAQQRRLSSFALWSRSRLNLPVYVVIVSVVHAFGLYRRVQERDRRALELTTSLSQAKLQALRLQLQPHFLFNTLNAIATLVHTDPDRADEMIVNLSDMLRLSLEVGEQEVPLRRELEILDRYLQIEQMRLGERLRVERVIEPAALEARVPPLLLQTIVENAIRHGIEPRAAPGTVRVSATKSGENLLLRISDDGIGLAASERFSERRGVGLANTESRLKELYGTEGRIELHEPAEGGCRVEITIPWRVDPPNGTKPPRPASL